MSAPDRALQNLNLDEMPVTRSHARSSRRGRGREQLPSASARMDPLSRPAPHPPESSRHGLRGPQRPGSLGPSRVNRVIRVTNHGTSIEFRLQPAPIQPRVGGSPSQSSIPSLRPGLGSNTPEQVIVRIYYDTIRGNHRAFCTCGEPNYPCFHAWWLVDRLITRLLNSSGRDALPMRQRVGELYPHMLNTGEASLRRIINDSFDNNPDDDEDRGRNQPAEAEDLVWPSARTEQREQEQQYNMCDVLSSFDRYRTPEELHHEAVNRSPAMTSRTNYLVENDIYATLYRVAMRERHAGETLQDPASSESRATMGGILQDLVSIESRATKYYEMQRSRVDGVMNDFSITVPGRALVLRNIVHQVYEDRQIRFPQHSQAIQDRLGELLADFLVELVRSVLDERRGADQAIWMRNPAAQPNKPANERNIYAYLISDRPEPGPHMPEKLTNLFVVGHQGRFRDLDAPSQWSHTRARWDQIRADIWNPVTMSDDEREYADKIKELLFWINGTVDPSEHATLHRMPR